QPDIDRYSDLCGAVNVRAELKKMIAWCDANPRKRKTKQGIEKFIQGWLGREQDKGRYLPLQQGDASVDTQDEVTVIQNEVA
ncbi:helix-turn-helix domain-containing protein, partial [Vibrio parahaemolyticus]|nr:helix-turn-helix domain-containing protein [Vibrio parahaemolyticus]